MIPAVGPRLLRRLGLITRIKLAVNSLGTPPRSRAALSRPCFTAYFGAQ